MIVRAFAVLAIGAAAAQAGGFWVEFGNPSASYDAAAKNAVATIRATGCHQPEKAAFTVTAEGVVGGVRQSVPVQVIPLSTPGLYAIPQKWPTNGSWVLKVEGSIDGRVLSRAVVPVHGNAIDRPAAKRFSSTISESDIIAALH